MSSQAPTIAIFGATGGVANSVLVHALRAGANILRDQNISEEVISEQLTIVTGSALDPTAVKSTLTGSNTPNHIVSHIITGLGASPYMRWNWSNPLNFIGIDQPSLCGDAAHILVAALSELYASSPALAQQKPKITFVSTTGITRGVEDVPWLMRFLYHQMLYVPHLDKREMEATYRDNTTNKNVVFGGVIGLRPTLLTGGINADEGLGWEKIRTGREAAPALGYSISRADVGQWAWINIVGDNMRRKEWEGEMITLTN